MSAAEIPGPGYGPLEGAPDIHGPGSGEPAGAPQIPEAGRRDPPRSISVDLSDASVTVDDWDFDADAIDADDPVERYPDGEFDD